MEKRLEDGTDKEQHDKCDRKVASPEEPVSSSALGNGRSPISQLGSQGPGIPSSCLPSYEAA